VRVTLELLRRQSLIRCWKRCSRLPLDVNQTTQKRKSVRVGRLAGEDMVRLNRAVLVFLGIVAPASGEQRE